jgi:predicted enzyme related to lactoylglutathione lyase
MIYYRVDSIQDACATLRSRGVRFENDPVMAHRTEDTELWLAGFKDPEGNYLCLMSEVSV